MKGIEAIVTELDISGTANVFICKHGKGRTVGDGMGADAMLEKSQIGMRDDKSNYEATTPDQATAMWLWPKKRV